MPFPHLLPDSAAIDHEAMTLGETAIEAAGPGRLAALHRGKGDDGRWTAVVRRDDGSHRTVDLDTRLGVAVVRLAG